MAWNVFVGRAEQDDIGVVEHPAAFAPLTCMPEPPPVERCSLPDPKAKLLGITISEGQAAWPDEA